MVISRHIILGLLVTCFLTDQTLGAGIHTDIVNVPKMAQVIKDSDFFSPQAFANRSVEGWSRWASFHVVLIRMKSRLLRFRADKAPETKRQLQRNKRFIRLPHQPYRKNL